MIAPSSGLSFDRRRQVGSAVASTARAACGNPITQLPLASAVALVHVGLDEKSTRHPLDSVAERPLGDFLAGTTTQGEIL